jgi:hypothetical protein
VAALLAAATSAVSADAVDAVPPGPVRDPYWGTVLFELYQQRTFPALVNLLVAGERQRLPHHAEEAGLLRGGLLLDHGLDAEAERVLAGIDASTPRAGTRGRVALMLARHQERQGRLGDAEATLARLGPAVPAALQAERRLLLARLQMARGDAAGAAATLADVPPGGPLDGYVRFNRGVALLRAGDSAGGRAVLEQLGSATVPEAGGEPARSLRDRANLALGLDALRGQDPAAARVALQRVRLEGPQSHAALLAYGWAALQQQDTPLALKAFGELAGRPTRDAPVFEARLARAHATGQAGAALAAREAYTAALESLAAEQGRLQTARQDARSGVLVDRLLGAASAARLGAPLALPAPAATELDGLLPVLAGHPVHQALRELGDLRFGVGHLQAWQASLQVLDEMLAERRSTFAARQPVVAAAAARLDLQVWETRGAALRDDWQRAGEAADGQAHADARERALQERLDRVRDALPQLDEADREALSARWRRAQGALRWHQAREHPARHDDARRDLLQLEAELQRARERLVRLQAAFVEEPQRLEQLAARTAAVRQRVALLLPRLVALSSEQQTHVQALLDDALVGQQQRVASYAEDAHWAMAQLLDSARADSRVSAAPGGGDAPR